MTAAGVSPAAGAAGVLPVAVVRLTAPLMLVGFIVMMTSSLILM
ncbi:C4-dicarboxylate ABC transporter [Cutibacterium acnes]